MKRVRGKKENKTRGSEIVWQAARGKENWNPQGLRRIRILNKTEDAEYETKKEVTNY